LANLHISPEEKLYVRDFIQADGGIEKLLASKDYLYSIHIGKN
jgi:hypothetical protein